MKTIVVPLDGSVLAEQALPYAQYYASLLGAGVLLLRTVTDEEQRTFVFRRAADMHLGPLPYIDEKLLDEASSELKLRAATYLDSHAGELRAAGLHVTASVDEGDAAECIVQAAGACGEALVVMATHGLGGLRRWTLGSTADRVVHAATTPVFLVRAGAAPQRPAALRRILVPLDGSPLSEQALPVAAELAQRAHAELIILHALTPAVDVAPAFAPMGRPVPVPGYMIDDEYVHERERLQLTADHLRRPEIEVTPVVELGYAADVILDQAAVHRADLIVMATHGRSGLRRWLLGSVADKVLHAARTPLLLVRASEV